ncbi:hypothetical protein OAN76_02565 [Candidatus Marinimicrobia bacterium]|nr:hypothetical protein [Candidatus Neomarinimicrobiota bacterium]|tara:strand:+ start:2118 stop:2396 length:279 start_codon:yes stop_codon:yes gene_type:complete
MKVKQLVGLVEHAYGRKSHKYLMNLLNDGLDDIAQTARNNTSVDTTGLVKGQRWYTLNNLVMIDVQKVEVLDDELNWRAIPKGGAPEIGSEL